MFITLGMIDCHPNQNTLQPPLSAYSLHQIRMRRCLCYPFGRIMFRTGTGMRNFVAFLSYYGTRYCASWFLHSGTEIALALDITTMIDVVMLDADTSELLLIEVLCRVFTR